MNRVMNFENKQLTTSTCSMNLNLMSKLLKLGGKKTRFLYFRHCSEMFIQTPNLTERDFVLMWNLIPGSYEEAKQLVPGLAQVP